jgi:hypothetical protein
MIDTYCDDPCGEQLEERGAEMRAPVADDEHQLQQVENGRRQAKDGGHQKWRQNRIGQPAKNRRNFLHSIMDIIHFLYKSG